MKAWVAIDSETEDGIWKTQVIYVFKHKKDAQEWLNDYINSGLDKNKKYTEFKYDDGELYGARGFTQYGLSENKEGFYRIEEFEILDGSYKSSNSTHSNMVVHLKQKFKNFLKFFKV